MSNQPQANRPGEVQGRGPGAGFAMGVSRAKNPGVTLSRLSPYLLAYKLQLALIGIFVILGTVASLLGPYFVGVAVDQYIRTGNVPGLYGVVDHFSSHLRCGLRVQRASGHPHGEDIPEGAEAAEEGALRAPPDPQPQLLRQAHTGGADEQAHERHRRNKPGTKPERHAADIELPLHHRDTDCHVHPERLAGAWKPPRVSP